MGREIGPWRKGFGFEVDGRAAARTGGRAGFVCRGLVWPSFSVRVRVVRPGTL